mmetsp:Transcript_7583/g.14619  ORF Transcript_7583/g.14619 Transcript_7583/m.14619 type:complete len:100 (+) Transcript_7583:2655-2954(+)
MLLLAAAVITAAAPVEPYVSLVFIIEIEPHPALLTKAIIASPWLVSEGHTLKKCGNLAISVSSGDVAAYETNGVEYISEMGLTALEAEEELGPTRATMK